MALCRAFTVLAILQVIAVVVGWLFALGDIEVIVFLGPLLSLTALVILVVALLRRLWLGALFALAVPLLSVICFFTIFLNRWSPTDAYYPINSLIAAFALAHAAFCILVIRDVKRRMYRPEENFNYQFSIGGIMIFTGFVAATLGLQRAFGFTGLAVGVVLWYLMIIAWYVWTEPRQAVKTTP